MDDNAKFCLHCGTPAEHTPEQEAPIELNTQAVMPEKKKKKVPVLLIALLSLVAVCGVLVAVFFQDIVGLFGKPGDSSGETLFQSVYGDAAHSVSKGIGGLFKLADTQPAPQTDITSQLNMKLRIGEAILQTLSSGGMDLSWLTNLNIRQTVVTDKDLAQVRWDLLLKDAAVSVDMIYGDNGYWIGLPGLSDTYLKFDMAALGIAGGADISGMQLPKLELSQAEVEAVLNRYFDITVKNIKNVKKENATIEAEGISQDVVQLTATLNGDTLLAIAKDFYKTLQEDEQARKLLDGLSEYCNALAAELSKTGAEEMPEKVDFYAELLASMAIAANSPVPEEIGEGKIITYLDSSNQIVGIALTDETGTAFSCLRAEQDGSFGLCLTADQVTITGKGTVSGGKETATYKLIIQEETAFSLKTKKFAVSEDGFEGTLTLILPDELVTQLMGASMGIELGVQLAQTADDQIDVDLVMAGQSIMGLSFTAEETEQLTIVLPEKTVPGEDETVIQQWLEGIDFEPLLKQLAQAGVPVDSLMPGAAEQEAANGYPAAA